MSDPTSLSERRALDGDDCMAWSPRDLLVYFLRRIDSGEFVPDAITVCYSKHFDGQTLTGMKRSQCTVMESVAMCEMAKYDLLGGERG
jgi:hypothetical protein